ncbi:MAG: c-type cytochrome, partial [Burkholderiales bacterium]|nr:c-type cytochrome [Anaerolineae bacterium]
DDLLAFLRWTGIQPDAANWPPYTIRVSGSDISVSSVASEAFGALPAQAVSAAVRGRDLFTGSPGNCATCHALEPDVVIVGPSLAGVATRAGERIFGQSAEEYLRNSILHPSEFVVPGFPDVMARSLGDALSGDEISALIAFLLTLE